MADSTPGQLETELILRSAALRDPVLEQSGVPVLRCGAIVRPCDDDEACTVAAFAELPPATAPVGDRLWWRRTALYRSGAAT